jgi:hypothetical protein
VALDPKKFTLPITRSSQQKEFPSRVLVRNLFGGPLGDGVATDAASGIGSEAYSDSLVFHIALHSDRGDQLRAPPYLSQYIHRRVKVKVLDLLWGGEHIQNPCQYAHGFVLGLVDDPSM